MVKLAQNKKKTASKAKASTSSKAKRVAKAVDTSESNTEESLDEEENAESSKTKSTLLNECMQNFDTKDLYEVLNLEKKSVNQTESKTS